MMVLLIITVKHIMVVLMHRLFLNLWFYSPTTPAEVSEVRQLQQLIIKAWNNAIYQDWHSFLLSAYLDTISLLLHQWTLCCNINSLPNST